MNTPSIAVIATAKTPATSIATRVASRCCQYWVIWPSAGWKKDSIMMEKR
jgi:hypothetical protein